MKKEKQKIIINVVLIIITIGFITTLTLYVTNLRNTTVHCTQKLDGSTLDLYYEFRNGKVFRYTSVTNTKISSNDDVEKREKMNKNNDEKYPKFVVKGWKNGETYTTLEVFDFDYLTDSESKALTGTTSTDWKQTTRRQLLKTFVPMGNNENGNFTCK